MSDPQTKIEKSKFKDAKQAPLGDKTRLQKSKKDKPIIVEYKWLKGIFRKYLGEGWLKWGKYKNIDIAKKVIKDSQRKHPVSYRFRTRDTNMHEVDAETFDNYINTHTFSIDYLDNPKQIVYYKEEENLVDAIKAIEVKWDNKTVYYINEKPS